MSVKRAPLWKVRKQIDDAISDAKTDLSVSRNATTVTVENDQGTDAAIPSADATTAGILTAAEFSRLQGIPAGGATGEVLTKTDGTDYNTEWAESASSICVINGGKAASRYCGALSITSISPATGTTAGGTSVTITGENFDTSALSTAVTFGGLSASSVAVVSLTTITCETPQNGGDSDFSDVALLLRFDGSDGATTFTDDSNASQTVSGSGNVQIDTAQSKFGGSSALFDGTNDYLSISSPSADLREWWNTSYTIEAWIRPDVLSGWDDVDVPALAGNMEANTGTNFWSFGPTDSGELAFYYFNGSATKEVSSTAPVTTGSWQHVAASFDGTTMRLFHNGTEVHSFTVSGTPQSDSGTPFTIGATDNQDIDGWVDSLRITKGVARYTANFTPPSEDFGDATGNTGDVDVVVNQDGETATLTDGFEYT